MNDVDLQYEKRTTAIRVVSFLHLVRRQFKKSASIASASSPAGGAPLGPSYPLAFASSSTLFSPEITVPSPSTHVGNPST